MKLSLAFILRHFTSDSEESSPYFLGLFFLGGVWGGGAYRQVCLFWQRRRSELYMYTLISIIWAYRSSKIDVRKCVNMSNVACMTTTAVVELYLFIYLLAFFFFFLPLHSNESFSRVDRELRVSVHCCTPARVKKNSRIQQGRDVQKALKVLSGSPGDMSATFN